MSESSDKTEAEKIVERFDAKTPEEHTAGIAAARERVRGRRRAMSEAEVREKVAQQIEAWLATWRHSVDDPSQRLVAQEAADIARTGHMPWSTEARDLAQRREHMTCHRDGDRCTWDGCPNQEDDRACEGCFLMQGQLHALKMKPR